MTASPEEPLFVPDLDKDLDWEEYAALLHDITKANPDEESTGH